MEELYNKFLENFELKGLVLVIILTNLIYWLGYRKKILPIYSLCVPFVIFFVVCVVVRLINIVQ